jgi:hypothetical protein
LITIGGVAVALATLQTASAASKANGEWQEAVRAQTKYTSATVANARKVYVDEAPLALAINGALFRAEELQRRAEPGDSPLRVQATAERAAAERYLREFRAAQGPINELVATAEYTPGSGIGAPQLGRRLATLQAGNQNLADAVRGRLAAGDEAGRDVSRGGWGIVAGALIALAGFILWWWPALPALHPLRTAVAALDLPTPRRPVLGLYTGAGLGIVLRNVMVLSRTSARHASRGSARHTSRSSAQRRPSASDVHPPSSSDDRAEPPDVAFAPPELPPVPPEGDPPTAAVTSWSPAVAVVLGLIAAVVTAGQIQAGATESRLLADAARRADVVAGMVTGGLIRQTFTDSGLQTGALLGQRADELARAGGDRAQAAADNATSQRIAELTADIGVQPTADDGVDAFTEMIVSGLQGQAGSMDAEQEAVAAAAEAAGTRSDRLVVVLFALTVAASLIEIARSLSAARPATLVRLTGLGLAAAAVLYASFLALFS